MCKCGCPLSLKPLPLVRFCPHLAWPLRSPSASVGMFFMDDPIWRCRNVLSDWLVGCWYCICCVHFFDASVRLMCMALTVNCRVLGLYNSVLSRFTQLCTRWHLCVVTCNVCYMSSSMFYWSVAIVALKFFFCHHAWFYFLFRCHKFSLAMDGLIRIRYLICFSCFTSLS